MYFRITDNIYLIRILFKEELYFEHFTGEHNNAQIICIIVVQWCAKL